MTGDKKPKLDLGQPTVRFLTDAEMRAIDEANPPVSGKGYSRVDMSKDKAKGWPRLRFEHGKSFVEWQCAFCDEWCAGPQDEHSCTPGNKA
jgi:hypothetical protein